MPEIHFLRPLSLLRGSTKNDKTFGWNLARSFCGVYVVSLLFCDSLFEASLGVRRVSFWPTWVPERVVFSMFTILIFIWGFSSLLHARPQIVILVEGLSAKVPPCRSATEMWFSSNDSHQFPLKHNVFPWFLSELSLSPNDFHTFYKTSHVRIIMSARVLILVQGFPSKVEQTAKMNHFSFIKPLLFRKEESLVSFITLDKLL